MPIPPFHNALILTGPTGSGKTELALTLAERLEAEIVVMDSMTLYRGMDVGTAKPTPEQRRRVPHHLLDVLDPWESSSVAWWLDQAATCCQEIEGRGRRVLLVGGTALYLKAVLFGLFDGPPADLELRQRLEAEADLLGRTALHERLTQVDAVCAARLHPNDLRRVVRALEVWELTGKPLSQWQQQWPREEQPPVLVQPPGASGRSPSPLTEEGCAHSPSPLAGEGTPAPSPLAGEGWGGGDEPAVTSPPHPNPPPPGGREQYQTASPGAGSSTQYPPRVYYLNLPRDVLYARINARVEQMIANGLIEEVKRLRCASLSREAAQALGYKELFDHLDGLTSLQETVERIQTRSRNFAKRQLTWFRHLPGVQAIEPRALLEHATKT